MILCENKYVSEVDQFVGRLRTTFNFLKKFVIEVKL